MSLLMTGATAGLPWRTTVLAPDWELGEVSPKYRATRFDQDCVNIIIPMLKREGKHHCEYCGDETATVVMTNGTCFARPFTPPESEDGVWERHRAIVIVETCIVCSSLACVNRAERERLKEQKTRAALMSKCGYANYDDPNHPLYQGPGALFSDPGRFCVNCGRTGPDPFYEQVPKR